MSDVDHELKQLYKEYSILYYIRFGDMRMRKIIMKGQKRGKTVDPLARQRTTGCCKSFGHEKLATRVGIVEGGQGLYEPRYCIQRYTVDLDIAFHTKQTKAFNVRALYKIKLYTIYIFKIVY